MHRCLRVPELLSSIVQFCDRDNAKLSLALACRFFLEPILDVLWHEQTSLFPLLKCFPPHVYRIDKVQSRNLTEHVMHLRRSPTINDWARVQFYAYRIKRFRFDGQLNQRVGDDILATLSLHRPVICLFPFLRYLHYDKRMLSPFYLPLLLGPCLTTFSIPKIDENDSAAVGIIQNLKHLPPRLESLTLPLHGMGNAGAIITQLPSVILAFSNLRYFACPNYPLKRDSMISLATLPNLRQMKFMLGDDLSAYLLSINGNFFPALTHFEVFVTNLSYILSYIRLISSKDVTSASIIFEFYPTGPQLHDISRELQKHPSCQTYKSITFRQVFKSRDHPNTSCLITRETLRPLLTMRNLACVHISLCYSIFHLDDAIIRDMSVAWPKLQTLYLIPSAKTPEAQLAQTTVSLNGLIPLSVNCPRLQILGLHIDARNVEQSTINTSDYHLRSQPLKLVLKHPSIDDPACVAAFLSGIFPNITKILASFCLDTQADSVIFDRWRTVSQLFKVFVDVRQQERNRTKRSDQLHSGVTSNAREIEFRMI